MTRGEKDASRHDVIESCCVDYKLPAESRPY